MFDRQGIKGISATYLEKLLQIIDSYITKRLKLREEKNHVPNDDMLDMLLSISQENGQMMDNTKIKHLFLVNISQQPFYYISFLLLLHIYIIIF